MSVNKETILKVTYFPSFLYLGSLSIIVLCLFAAICYAYVSKLTPRADAFLFVAQECAINNKFAVTRYGANLFKKPIVVRCEFKNNNMKINYSFELAKL